MRKLIVVGILLVACLPQVSHAHEYLGCFVDKLSDRLLNGKATTDEKMSVTKCIDICIDEGDYYAALEYGDSCFCGKERKIHEQLPDGYCRTECFGDFGYLCGGVGVAAVYTTHVCSVRKLSSNTYGDPCPGTSACNDTSVGGKGTCKCPLGYSFDTTYRRCVEAYRFMGCFEDKSDKMLKGTFTFGDMTIDKCLQTCIEEGNYFAGLENANDCYCGDYLENYDRLENNKCNLPCTGDASLTCGANMKISVYATNKCKVTEDGDPCPLNGVCTDQTIGGSGVCECSFGYILDVYDKFCERVCTVRNSGDPCPGDLFCSDQIKGGSGVCKCASGFMYDAFTRECIGYEEKEFAKVTFEIAVNEDDRELVYSPLYIVAEYYFSNVEVDWLIDTQGHDLLLNILDFHTEGCCDQLIVNYKPGDDGNTVLAGVEKGKSTLQSKGSVSMKFKADIAMEKSGFLIQYIALLKDRVIGLAGAEFDATTELKQVIIARVDDPRIQLFYFQIRAPENHRVRVTVNYMDMEPSVFCKEDYLKMFDGEEILLHACRDRKFAAKVEVSSVQELVTIQYSCTFSTQVNRGKLCAVINYRAYVYEGTTLQNTSQIMYNMTLFQHHLLPLNTSYLVFKVDCSIGPVNISLYSYRSFGKLDYAEATFTKLNNETLTISFTASTFGGSTKSLSLTTDNVLSGYKNFWFFIDGPNIRLGEGSNVGENQLSTIYMPRILDFTTFSTSSLIAGILYQEDSQHDQECEFLDAKRTTENVTYGIIKHATSNNSYEYKLWTIEKLEHQVLSLKIQQSLLTKTPDCIYERVTIYRGYCPIKTNAITYFCGKTIELITQTHGRFTTIEYRNSFIPYHILMDQDVTLSRAFRIRFEIVGTVPDNSTDTTDMQMITTVVIPASGVVVIIVIACILIVVIWKKKNPASTAPVHPLGMQDTLQQAQLLQQLMPNQAIVLNIHVGNQEAGGAAKHNEYEEEPDPPGVPPPAVYIPPHTVQDEAPPAPYDMDSEY